MMNLSLNLTQSTNCLVVCAIVLFYTNYTIFPRDCVHIKGLSQNVTESDIIGFLSCYQSSVVWTHIHYNPKRKCSGSAFVQMCSADEASRCANECNQKFFPDW